MPASPIDPESISPESSKNPESSESSDPEHPEQPSGKPSAVTPSRVIAGVCLLVPFVALLWVSSYARLTPSFIGIPFFYWYQLAWVPAAAALTYTAYVLVRREERARKGGRS